MGRQVCMTTPYTFTRRTVPLLRGPQKRQR